MEIPILTDQYEGEDFYTMNCGDSCHNLPACGGCNCFRFTYSGGVVTNYKQAHGCTQSGENLYAATTKAECDAKIAELELTPKAVEYLSCEFIINSGATKNFQLPTESDGDYDPLIWKKKVTDKIYTGDPINFTTYDDPKTLLAFDDDDFYNVLIQDKFHGFRFNNGGDKSKIINIQNWGSLKLGNNQGYFYGCNNLIVTAKDLLNTQGTTDFKFAFPLTTSLATIPNIGLWNMSSVISTWGMFNGSTFDDDISRWIVAQLLSATSMFINGSLSTVNYNALLIAWAAQSVQTNVNFHAGSNCKYSAGAPADARAVLAADPNFWIFTDGGQE